MSFFKTLANITTNMFKVKDVTGFENLQKNVSTKKEYLEKVLSCFNNINSALKTFSETILSSEKTLNSMEMYPGEKKINDAVVLICQKIKENNISNNDLLSSATNNISEYSNKLNEILSRYEHFKKKNKDLQQEKANLASKKESYHKLGKEAENKIKSMVKHTPDTKDIFEKEEYIEQLQMIGNPAKEALESYKSALKKTNELTKQYNQRQTALYELLPSISEKDQVFDFELMKLYHKTLEAESKYLNTHIETFKNSHVEVKSELKDLIDILENNKKDEKLHKFSQYQTELDINKCQSDADFKILCHSIELVNLYVDKSLFPDYEYETEQKIYNIQQILRQLFKETGEINSKLCEDFFNGLKEQKVHRKFFILLSQLRTNNKFLRTKYLIDLLGQGFDILLNFAGKNKIYDNVKSCIILSQTYYYEGENKKKVYIFEKIKKNKYLQNSHFWRKFIEDMIEKEFKRLELILPDVNFSVENNINITPKIKEKLNEAVFSQLITYGSNMRDFDLDKRVILKILEEFFVKYNYLTEANIKNIYTVLSEEPDEIERLRKEYNTSLESELINENDSNEEEKEKEKEKTEDKNKESDNKENEEKTTEKKENEEKATEGEEKKSDNNEEKKTEE